MFQVPLAALPNQSVSFNVDGAYWQIDLFQAATQMCANVTRNGVDIIRGVRCYVGQPLMPFEHMNNPAFGNFVFDAEPDWTEFESGCNLLYMDKAEYEEFHNLMKLGG